MGETPTHKASPLPVCWRKANMTNQEAAALLAANTRMIESITHRFFSPDAHTDDDDMRQELRIKFLLLVREGNTSRSYLYRCLTNYACDLTTKYISRTTTLANYRTATHLTKVCRVNKEPSMVGTTPPPGIFDQVAARLALRALADVTDFSQLVEDSSIVGHARLKAKRFATKNNFQAVING